MRCWDYEVKSRISHYRSKLFVVVLKLYFELGYSRKVFFHRALNFFFQNVHFLSSFFLSLSFSSTGSFHHNMPLRSSLKKPKNKEFSITSDSSSKRVRYGLGGEQTNVWWKGARNLEERPQQPRYIFFYRNVCANHHRRPRNLEK